MIYAISGLKRTGKDTVSKFIQEMTGATPYALAYPIKKALHYAMCERSDARLSLSWKDINGETSFDREKDLELSTLELKSILNNAILYCNREFNKFEFTELAKLMRDVSELKSSDSMSFWDIFCLSFAKFFGNTERVVEIENKYKWSVRRLMQTLGTDLIVNVRRDYWLQCIPTYGSDIIITDIRQTHEMQYCRDNNAKVIFVVKSGIVSKDSHITERGLEPKASDIIVYNDGTLESLKSKIQSLI
ncbi:dNMP kinase [Aeromonas phage ZPAH1]|nr:dNMP kinase [Aeromonas phage Aswh_1]QQG34069.1 dNMP kinase [Aeromonas phage ZPAH1]